MKNTKRNVIVMIALGLAVASAASYAFGCAGSFEMRVDALGNFYHQHYACNAFGCGLTYFHY